MIAADATGFVCASCGQRYDQGGYCPHDGNRLAETDDPLLGADVGRYRLARLLGEGGMGRVYLAVQPAIGSRVAVKILSDQCARNPELLERFFAEARAVNLIRHENIVSVIDLARLPDGRPFIVMEYVEGQTLAGVAHAGPVPLGGLVQAMSEVLSALAAAHAIGIVHRDLKPDNVLITGEGHAKVLDFGIAKLAPELQQQLSPRTRTGALLGTPQYMAPEQISGAGSVDPRTDLYAAGVVLYELVTGQQPFVGETLFDLMRAHLEEPPPPMRPLRPDLPPALERVILTALAKQPDQRFPDAAAMAQALQHAAADLPADQWRSLSSRSSSSLPGRVPTPVPSPLPIPLAVRQTRAVGPPATQPQLPQTMPRRGRIGLVVGGVVIAALAVGMALLVMMRSEPQLVATAEQPGSGATATTPPVGSDTTATAPTSGSDSVATAPARTGKRRPARPAAVAGAGSAAAPGPTIVGGGSAVDEPGSAGRGSAPQWERGSIDHGVHSGSNVQIGPNVIIGSQTPLIPPAAAAREALERPADYNPKRFDPVAYLPKALRLARELLPDAQLTSFEFDPVFPDGHVDLTMEGRDREYQFRSPERSAFPAGRPRNLPIDRKCRVAIEVGPRSITARVLTSESCDDRLVRAPRCSLATVWSQALAKGVPGDLVARIGWLFDEKWFFDIDFAGKGGGVSTFADRCP